MLVRALPLLMFVSAAACTGRGVTDAATGNGGSDAGIVDGGASSSSSSSSSSGGTLPAGTLGSACGTAGDCTALASPACEHVLSGEPVSDGVCIGTACALGETCEADAGRCFGNALVAQCVLACSGAGSCVRAGFGCFSTAEAGNICLPATRSQCTPSTGMGCATGETCRSAGPDDIGYCVGGCDPDLQDCPQDAGVQGCYLGQGAPFCSPPVDAQEDYAVCTLANGCHAGRACVQVYDEPRCYLLCNPDAAEPRCPTGRCQPLFGAHLCVVDEPSDGGA